MDFLVAKLAIDKAIDPKLSTSDIRKQIDGMESDIRKMLPPSPTAINKLKALREYLYDAGYWNDNKPFSYDMDDPLGQSETSRLLHNYLETRKGNCVSMPILHAILGRRLGLNMTLSTAPRHVYVKYIGTNGKTVNIEATSGGHPARDDWYHQKIPMTDTSIKNGVYMKVLSDKEAVVVMAHDLANHYIRTEEFTKSIKLTNKLVRYYPTFAPMHVTRGSAYAKMIDKEFYQKYPTSDLVPSQLVPIYENLMYQNMLSFANAEHLGWREEPNTEGNKSSKLKRNTQEEDFEEAQRLYNMFYNANRKYQIGPTNSVLAPNNFPNIPDPTDPFGLNRFNDPSLQFPNPK